MKTLRVIKEPIHDYIGLSELENVLINDPLFLRLQHVSQNGLAYLTYPNNRTSRFTHSLGTMHVGGEMVLAIINSADKEIREDFLQSFRGIVNEAAENVSVTLDKIEHFIATRCDAFYMHSGLDPQDPKNTLPIVLLQSMRIACVMHDLGHPPFSHSTEMVLKSKFNSLPSTGVTGEYKKFGEILTNLRRGEQGQLHEKMGKELVLYVFSGVGGELANYGKLCFWVANRILSPENAKDDPKRTLACLHSILSGEAVDADRCDYVLRDGYASSFEFGEYDLTRILHNLRLSLHGSGDFEVLSTTTAASALESFFLERYRIWRWIVFHPNVVRAELALSRALNILLEIFFAETARSSEETTVRTILERLKFSKLWQPFETQGRYREYISCDESWLLFLFRTIQESIGNQEWLPRRIAILKACLDFVLDRKKSSACFATLWKRAEEYEEFASAVDEASASYKAILKATGMTRNKENATEWVNRLISTVLAKDLKNGEVQTLRLVEDRLQMKLRDRGFEGALLTRVLTFAPYKECFLMDKSGKQVPLSRLSSVIENLTPTWSKDIQFRVYWIGLEENSNRFRRVDGRVPSRKELANCFLEVLLDDTQWASLKVLTNKREKRNGKSK